MCLFRSARPPRRRKGLFWDTLSPVFFCDQLRRSRVALSKSLRVHMAFIYFVLIAANSCLAQQQPHSRSDEGSKSRGLFSPRMQYDEWTPLGRGDPLKNDPTFDYMPPVLERVQYWMPPAARTPDPPRSTTSTGPPPVVLDRRYQELTGVQTQQQRVRQQYVPIYYQAHRPHHHHYHHHHHNHPPAPQTVLVPPPAPGKPSHQQSGPQYQANSIFPSSTSSLPNNELWETQLATVAASSTSQPQQQLHHQAHSRDTISFVNSQQVDITPSPSILHYILHSELASVPPSPPPHSVIFPSPTPTPVPTTTAATPFMSSTLETSTVATRMTTTSNPSLTTDPLFSHYKQPAQPIKGPMYLIIQGHSKVKTYGPAKIDKISGIPVQESNDITSNDNTRYERSSR